MNGAPEPRGSRPPADPPERGASVEVPRALQYATAYSWRLLLVGAAVFVLVLVLAELRVLVLATFFALFATALLRPVALWLRGHGLGRGAAAAASLGGGVALLAGVMAAIVPAFVDQLDELGTSLRQGVEDVGDWLLEGPLDLSESELDDYIDRGVTWLEGNSATIAGGVFDSALFLLELIVALLVALVMTFFFLRDGERMWGWLLQRFQRGARADVAEIGDRAWRTLGGYLRGVTIVALFDAAFIGLALVIVGVPAALPLAVVTFFGAYVPIVGAVVTGLAAVLVALVANGPVAAAIVAAAVLVVQQVESNLLQPVVVGRAVALHPVVTLLAVTAGALLAGIIGALIAVPIAAVLARVGGYLEERGDRDAVTPASGP